MNADVKICVDARVDFFDKYYCVPAEMSAEVGAFVNEVTALGERCSDAAEFESSFVSEGLSDRFNQILPRCTPKAVEMTAEQKAYSEQVRKEMEKDRNIMKEIAAEAADTAMMEAESEMIAMRRQARIEAGVDDEYNQFTNAVEDGKSLFGMLRNKFRKNR